MIVREEDIIETIKTVYDPEIPVDIYELGLIYKIEFTAPGILYVEMTLTSPMCPVADSLPMEVYNKLKEMVGIDEVELNVVYDPPWTKDKMSEEARFALDMF